MEQPLLTGQPHHLADSDGGGGGVGGDKVCPLETSVEASVLYSLVPVQYPPLAIEDQVTVPRPWPYFADNFSFIMNNLGNKTSVLLLLH